MTIGAFPLAPTPSSSERAPDAAKQAEFLRGLTLPNLPTRLEARVVKYLDFYRDDPRGKNILRIWARKYGRLAPALRADVTRDEKRRNGSAERASQPLYRLDSGMSVGQAVVGNDQIGPVVVASARSLGRTSQAYMRRN